MGFFSSIGKVLGTVGKVAGVVSGNPLVSIGSDIAGSLLSNAMSKSATKDSWNRSMDASNTSYQRAVADMRAANLNPILAYSQGGASTPTAQVASTSDLSQTGSRAVTNAMTTAQIDQSRTQSDANTAQALNLKQAALTGQSDMRLKSAQAENTALINDGLRALPPEFRALAQMSSSTGVDAHLVAKGASKLSRSVARAGRGAANYLKGGFRDLKKLPSILYNKVVR